METVPSIRYNLRGSFRVQDSIFVFRSVGDDGVTERPSLYPGKQVNDGKQGFEDCLMSRNKRVLVLDNKVLREIVWRPSGTVMEG